MTATKEAPASACQFNHYPATKILKSLAQTPLDLTDSKTLTKERLKSFKLEACGIKCLFGTERVTEQVLSALGDLAQEAGAVEKMRAMQDGAVTNTLEGVPSEDRPVLHTAIRDIFEHQNPSPAIKEIRELGLQEHEKLKAFMERIDGENRFTDLIFIGIGGSDLGPRCLYLSLEAYKLPGREVHFVANVDPDDFAAQVEGVDLSKAMAIVVSKSGTTTETTTNEALLRHAYQQVGVDSAQHIVSVTSAGSPMDDRTQYLECFHIWDTIGGRFSGTSMIGGVMLSFGLGYANYLEMLRGCEAMDKNALEGDPQKNLPLFLALLGIWNHNFLGYPTLGVVPYSQALHRFAAHLQQVDMESNGKSIDRQGRPVDFETGPIVFGEPGTNAQHSFYQLVHQGTPIVPVEYIGFKETQRSHDLHVQGTTSQEKLLSNLFAQSIALATGQQDGNPNKVFPGNRPSHILLSKKLTPFIMGALWAMVEHKIAFQGFIWDINSFDQEGVELGKVLAKRITARFAAKKDPGADEGEYPLGDALLEELEDL